MQVHQDTMVHRYFRLTEMNLSIPHRCLRMIHNQTPKISKSRTQVHICYKFSRCASAAANPNIGDVREINKVVRTLKSQYVDGRFWPLKGSQRIRGMPDASYRNNSDKSSQRAHVIFLAEDRKLPSKGTYSNSGYDKQADRFKRFRISNTWQVGLFQYLGGDCSAG